MSSVRPNWCGRRFVELALGVCVAAFGAASVSAQSTAAQVSGTIYDEQRAVLPGAKITLTNLDTGQVHETFSRPDGAFSIFSLTPGRYAVRIELANFTPLETSIELTITENLKRDAMLRLAALRQREDVTASALLAEPGKTELGRTITPRQIDELPVAGRDFTTLALLSPGILVNQVATGTSTGIATAAQTGRNDTFILDGLTLDNTWAASARVAPPLDAVQEFIVLSNGFSAEYGQASGAVLSVTTKSGTNRLAGRVYYYHRDDRWDATSYAARLAGLPDSRFEQKIAGSFIGGPIVRNRAFFFGSVERLMLDTENIMTSPALLHAFRPGAPASTPAGSRIWQLFGRTDVSPNPSSHLTVRVRMQPSTITNQLGAADVGISAPERGFDVTTNPYDIAVMHNLAGGASRFNEFRFQFAQSGFDRNALSYCAGCPDEQHLDIRLGKLSTVPSSLTERRVQFADSFTYQLPPALGDHLLKTGVDISAIGVDWHDLPDADGTFKFKTNKPFDISDESTYPTQYTRTFGNPDIHLDHTTYAAFFQDHWRPRGNVTVNAGLRWDFDHALGVSGDTKDLGPRVAVAFAPKSAAGLSIRGGYGRYYDQVPLTVAKLAEQAKTSVQVLVKNPSYPDPNINQNVLGASPPNTTRLANMETAFTDQLTAGLQWGLSPDTAFTVDGVYARGRHLLVTHDLNYPDLNDPLRTRPDPGFQRILAVESRGNSWYKGLQLLFEKRHSRGYSWSAAYTLSRSERDTEDYTFVPQDQRDFAAERGPAANDVRHRLSTAMNLDLPLGLRLTAVLTAQSAPPYTITTGIDNNRDTFINDRPGVSRNSARGSDFWQADARLSKSFRTAIGHVETLIEAFNLTNHANWAGYDGQTGRPTTAFPARQVQVGIRLDF